MELFDFSKEPTAKAPGSAPALFLSHGAPTAVLTKDGFSESLESFPLSFKRPNAIAVVSAHWLTRETIEISSSETNETIHDFGGFPRELYEMTYPAPGAPEIAGKMAEALNGAGLKTKLNPRRGLDHGAWIPLKIMYPNADVPVFQISLPYPSAAEPVYKMGKTLASFREQGVMLVGSGSMTHNLSTLKWGDENAKPERDAVDFDSDVMARVASGDIAWTEHYDKLLKNFHAMHPTDEHFLPIFFAMGCRRDGDELKNIYDGIHYGTMSLRCFAFL